MAQYCILESCKKNQEIISSFFGSKESSTPLTTVNVAEHVLLEAVFRLLY